MVQRNPHLRIRVVSGYTLTAAVVIKRLPKQAQEVFLVGSKEISRGVALYLASRGVRVLVINQPCPAVSFLGPVVDCVIDCVFWLCRC